MTDIPTSRLEITNATNIALTGGPACGAIINATMADGAPIELHLTAEAIARIEVLLEGARMAQAKIYGLH